VTVADIPATWLAIQKNLGQLSTPLSVALPPIVFARYINPSIDTPVIELALIRALTITGGMVAALLMNSLVFPRHCRVLFLWYTSHSLGLLSSLYVTLCHEMFHRRGRHVDIDRQKMLELEMEIRSSLYSLSALIVTMKNEFALLPV